MDDRQLKSFGDQLKSAIAWFPFPFAGGVSEGIANVDVIIAELKLLRAQVKALEAQAKPPRGASEPYRNFTD